MSCKLQLKDGKSGVYTAESIQALQDFIYETLLDAAMVDDAAALKFAIKKALYKIGDTYNDQRQLKELARQVEEVASHEDFIGLDQFFPEAGILNTLSTKNRPSYEEFISQDTFSETDLTKQGLFQIKEQFLNDFLGNRSTLKLQLKQEVINKLINVFVINREGGRIVSNIVDVNNEVRIYKQQLFDQVMDYLKKSRPNEYNVDSTLLYDGDTYTGILSKVKHLTKYLDDFSPSLLQKIYSTNKEQYDAIISWFVLKNFDNFVECFLGDAIQINPLHRNKFVNGDGYSYTKKGSQVITSYRTTDVINLNEEIGKLAQSLINSTPFYKFGIDSKSKQFITFEDFCRIIVKVKDLSLNNKSKEIIINEMTFPSLFGEESDLSKFEQDAINNKSLRQIINYIRNNPQLYSRLAFRILIHKGTIFDFNFSEEERDKLYSIYKGIFSSKDVESIYRIQNQDIYDYNTTNYYSLITQVIDSIFSTGFSQYYENEGIVQVRTLKDQTAENTRKKIEQVINNSNSKNILKIDFTKHQMEPYKAIPLSKNGKFDGIQFNIREDVIVKITSLGEEITVWNHGVLLTNENVEMILDSNEFKQFIDDQTNLGLSKDQDLFDAIGVVYNNYISQFNDLLKLSATIYMNKYISNVLLNNIQGKKETLNKLEQIHPQHKLKYNKNLGEITLVPTTYINILSKIAEAKSITTGEFQSSRVKDGEGNMLNSETLSRLLGAISSQWQSIIDNIGPASKFSLLRKNLFKGYFNAKEYKSNYSTKKSTSFTVSEFFQGAFLYDFVGGFIQVDNRYGKKMIGNNQVGLLPSVNSDKSDIGRIILDLNEPCEYFNNKKYSDLTIEELQEVICKELGQFYIDLQNKITQDFVVLQNYLNSKQINIVINPNDNFKELNEYCQKLEISAFEQLNDWVNDYNNNNTIPIKFIEETHFQKNGKLLKRNNTIQALLSRFSNIQNLNNFFNIKRTDLLKSLIDENTEISLLNENSESITPKKWLASEYKEWVNLSNGKMILAKLTYDGNVYDISNKIDFIKFCELVGVNFIKEPHKLLHPKYGITLNLHPMLDKYNVMDYLFTQEFMIAGVGTHTNHPGKGNFNTLTTVEELQKTGVYNSSFGSSFKVRLVDNIESDREIPVPARHIVENGESILILNTNLLEQKFKNKSWTTPAVLQDKTTAEPLPIDSFKTFEEFLNFVLEHEAAHSYNKIRKQETRGIYETRINNLALQSLYLKEQEGILAEEAARFLAQHKRNVSYTAAMHAFQLATIKGIPSECNIAAIEDITAPVYTISGDKGDHAPFDGATFTNPFMVYYENYSLEGDKAGTDKKIFVHFYDEATGTGGIIKTAGFGLTNDRIKSYAFYRTMMKNMTDRKWKNADGSLHIVQSNGIFTDLNNNNVSYEPVYFLKGNQYIRREILSYEGNNIYKVIDSVVDEYGNFIQIFDENGNLLPNSEYNELKIESNYNLWEMFGGYNSLDFKNGVLKPSEKSIELSVKAINNYGIIKPGVEKVKYAADVDQIMKKSDIHYMPTRGAIKQGIANINKAECFYKDKQLNYMTIKMTQSGIQLDKEHKADATEISLMTQVISAACANGFNPKLTNQLYNALYSLTKTATSEFRDQLGNLITGDVNKFKQATTGIILKAILNSTSSDGDLIQIVAKDIISQIKDSKDFNFSEEFITNAQNKIPTSDPAIYDKIVNIFTVALTKAGIKAPMAGNLAVLCPSHEIIKFYKIPVYNEFNELVDYKRVTLDKVEQEGFDLFTLQEFELPIEETDIELGYKYLIEVYDQDGNHFEVVHVNRIHGDTQNISTRKYQGKDIIYREVSYNEFKSINKKSIKEWIVEGQDLKSYNVRFNTNSGRYQLADLDIVQEYFKLKEIKSIDKQIEYALSLIYKYNKFDELKHRLDQDLNTAKYNNPVLVGFINSLNTDVLAFCNSTDQADALKQYLNQNLQKSLHRIMQQTLDSISPSHDNVVVTINGRQEIINKNTIQISNYGLVMPKTFKTSLGLDEFDSLQDIKADPDFFTKKLIQKFGTHVEIYENENGELINNFDLELKKPNGQHIYIKKGLDQSELIKAANVYKLTEENGDVFRVDKNGKVMYQLYNDSDEIYMDREGNEIIITSDEGIQFYLNSMDYISFNISRGSNDIVFEDILLKATLSTNTKASKLANNILKYNSNTLKRRQLVNKMNDYSSMLNDDETMNFAMQHLKELGDEMYTSFLRSLDIIAARIPSQNQQSFMAMQVESYDNPDINSAYVSLFQFFLQGSDLDIDAVSLQTFELDWNGLYVGHSPYYSLQDEQCREISDLLPFPTGLEAVIHTESNQDSILDYLNDNNLLGFTNKFNKQSLFNLDPREDGSIIVSIDIKDPNKLKQLVGFLNYVNNSGVKIPTSNKIATFRTEMYNSNPEMGEFTEDMINSIIQQITEFVNKHNLYLKKSQKSKQQQIIKNFLTLQLITIIQDPINRRQADSSVDVVTKPVKALAKSSPKATVQTTFTPGNVINKFQSISENMVGKDGIAICATGLKSFFALTQLYQTILNEGSLKEKDNLLFDVSFGGKTYKGLANGFSKNFISSYERELSYEEQQYINNNYSQEVQNYLNEQLHAFDAAGDLSALLGLSTDNAKELILSKINAGLSSIGMYIYGLSIGIPFDQLYQTMTTPLAFRLVELTKGNIFNQDYGTVSIIGALNYLCNDPVNQLKKFNTINSDVEKPYDVISKLIDKEIAQLTKNPPLNPIQFLIKGNSQKDFTKSLTNIKQKALKKAPSNKEYVMLVNQAIEFLESYAADVYLLLSSPKVKTIYGESYLFENLETLAMGAEEYKLLGKILRLNQKIETNTAALLGQISTIENLVIKRIQQMRQYYQRRGINQNNFNGSDALKNLIFTEDINKYKIDFIKFIEDSKYSEKVISFYDSIKQSFNPLKVITVVPHYKGYVESLYTVYKGLLLDSKKFEITLNKQKEFCNKYNISNTSLQQEVLKNAEKSFDLYVRQNWMKQFIPTIKIDPKTKGKQVYCFIDNTFTAKPLNYSTEIQLGTELGDANFKLLMETVVFPKLKEDFPDNIFIRDLQYIINNKTLLGTFSISKGLPINMLPNSSYEEAVFNNYKDSFNELIKYEAFFKQGKHQFMIQDLIYYYSLIVNGGKVGPNSLQSVFEDYMNREGTSSVYDAPKNYRDFISKIDLSDDEINTVINNFITDEMLAPIGNPYIYGTNIFKQVDSETGIVGLFIKEKTSSSSYEDYEEFVSEEFQEYEGPNEVNGFKKISSNALINNSIYFNNPISVTNLQSTEVLKLTEEEKQQYPILAKYSMSITNLKNKFGLVDIKAKNNKLQNIAEKYMQMIRDNNKGILLEKTIQDENNSLIVVLDKKQINSDLETLENNCI